jgi:hypothetical protein
MESLPAWPTSGLFHVASQAMLRSRARIPSRQMYVLPPIERQSRRVPGQPVSVVLRHERRKTPDRARQPQ